MTGLNQLLHGKDSQPPPQAPEHITPDTAAASAVLTGLLHCISLPCFTNTAPEICQAVSSSSPSREGRRQHSPGTPRISSEPPHLAKQGQQIGHLRSYLLCGADGACDMLEQHLERWSWPRPRSLRWPPSPATDEKSSSAATAPTPASAGCSGSRSRTGCRPSPSEKLAVLGQEPTGKSAGLTRLQQNPPANTTTKSTITEISQDLLGIGSKTN